MTVKKIKWHRPKPLRLVATNSDDRMNYVHYIEEKDLEEIHFWCEHNKCGVRTSFDTFVFKNTKEMSMFLLKWG